MQFEQKKLKNQLKTLFVHGPGSTAATVQIWFRAGSALETHDNEGIAHFLEHMFFKGTANRPGAKIAYDVESFGGEINAFTSFDYTCYYINTPSKEIEQTVDILLDMVTNPEFKEADLLPERDVVFEEYRRSIDSPSQYAFLKLQSSSFQGAYSHPILGREDTIKNFNRDALWDFRKNFYNLSNALFIVAGDLSHDLKEKLATQIERYQLPNGDKSSFPKFHLKKESSVDLHHKDVRMATLCLCFEAPAFNSKEAASEDLALNCLGHGETSRLYESLVLEETLANNASASTMFMSDGGAHFIRVVCPPENLKKVLVRLGRVLTQIVDEGVAQEELSKIKNQYVSSKIYELESIESFAFSLGHGFAQNGDINCEDEFINRIKKTSREEVEVALKNIFSRSAHLSLQLPKKESLEKHRKELSQFSSLLKKMKEKIKHKDKLPYKLQVSKFDEEAKLIKLKSGVSLFYRQNKMTPTFILHAYLRGGLTEESAKNNGHYHLLSSCITKGFSKTSYENIKAILEDRSAMLTGFAGRNAYGLMMHGLTENMHELAPLFIGSLLEPTFGFEHIKHEKELTLRALENQKEDPAKNCFAEANLLFFNGHPYSQNGLGTMKSIKGISRNVLAAEHKKNLKNKELVLSYCGDLGLKEVLGYLRPLIDKLPARTSRKVVYKKYKPFCGKDRFIKFDREQTQIFYGIPCGKAGDTPNLYLKLLCTHLSGQSSELFVEVRDRKGLCYSAQPVHFAALEGGYFGIYMASGFDKVNDALKAIKEIITKHKEHGLTREEFERIKKMIKGQNLINVQTNEDYAGIYSIALLQGQGIDYWHKGNLEIENLKYEEFQKGIKKILSREWNTIIVGRENYSAFILQK